MYPVYFNPLRAECQDESNVSHNASTEKQVGPNTWQDQGKSKVSHNANTEKQEGPNTLQDGGGESPEGSVKEEEHEDNSGKYFSEFFLIHSSIFCLDGLLHRTLRNTKITGQFQCN